MNTLANILSTVRSVVGESREATLVVNPQTIVDIHAALVSASTNADYQPAPTDTGRRVMMFAGFPISHSLTVPHGAVRVRVPSERTTYLVAYDGSFETQVTRDGDAE